LSNLSPKLTFLRLLFSQSSFFAWLNCRIVVTFISGTISLITAIAFKKKQSVNWACEQLNLATVSSLIFSLTYSFDNPNMTLNQNEPTPIPQVEPRWPAALTVLVAIGLVSALPYRIRLFPVWFVHVAAISLLASMTAVWLTRAKARWRRVEHIVMLLFVVVAGFRNLIGLASLIHNMLFQSQMIDGLTLLASSVSTWITNVLIFSLLYWQIDLGGPEARINNAGRRPDWLFPKTGVPEDGLSDWRPTFIDYLFLAYTTATAFSPTDTLPLTARAKLLLMLESAISMITIIVIASRAINILGS
jgi:hypothetical protein